MKMIFGLRCSFLTLSLLLLISITGCGETGPKIVPVKGTVKFKEGKPVTSGVIEFAPLSGGQGAQGKIEEDGSFTLMTGKQVGAYVGKHKIIVIQFFIADGAAAHVSAQHTASIVHSKHGRFDTSGLSCEVKSDGENVVDLVVDPSVPVRRGW
jgi:hypothetical protein